MDASLSITVLCLMAWSSWPCWPLIASAIRIVPEYQRLVVFRLGRCMGSRGPGIVLLIPVVDRAVQGRFARASARDPPPDLHHQR